MPGWVRFNPDDIKDYCPGIYSISDGNIEFSVSRILEKIDSWTYGNPNNKVFVSLPGDPELAWLSFCTVMQSLSGNGKKIFYYSGGSDEASPPAVMGKGMYVMVRGLNVNDHFGMFAEMPDWTEEVAKKVEDLGPLIVFYASASNENRMIVSASESGREVYDSYLTAGLIGLACSLILLLCSYLNTGVEITLSNFSWISVFPIISIILFISSVIFLALGSRTSRKGVMKYVGTSVVLFLLGTFGLIIIIVSLTFLTSGRIESTLSQALVSGFIPIVMYTFVFMSVFIYILPILRNDLHRKFYEFSISIISLYLLLGVFLPSKYIEIGAPPHYLIIGGHSHGIQPAFPASLLTIAVFLIMIAAPLYTQIRLPALRIMKPEEQNLSDNVAHD